MDTVKTPKGMELPLVNLKGKPYLQVAHRLMWFNEATPNFDISTEFLMVDDTQTIARATVLVKDEKGNVIRRAQATKRETKADFSDHTEKAETSAIGRALALLGYGTQFAIADLDEGDRIVDSPVTDTRKIASEKKAPSMGSQKKSVSGATLTNEKSEVQTMNGGVKTAPTPVVQAAETPAPAAPAAKSNIASFRRNKVVGPEAPKNTGKGGW